MDKVLFALAMAMVIGFSIGSALTLFVTSDRARIFTSFRDKQEERAAPLDGKVRLAESVLEKDPQNVLVLIDLGNSYFDTGLYQDAIDAYSRALSIDPKNVDVLNDLGIVYRELHQYDKAVEAFRQAALDDPLFGRSRYNLGAVLAYDMRDDQGAIKAWEEFLSVGPCMDRNDRRIKMVKSEIEKMKKRVPGSADP